MMMESMMMESMMIGFEKIKEGLKEASFPTHEDYYALFLDRAVEVVNQVAEGFATDTNVGNKDNNQSINQLANGWIPCGERLPDIGDYNEYPINLVTLENGDVCLGVYRNLERKWLTRMSMGEQWYTSNHTVLAWQPLPSPYQPKGEEK